MGLSDFEVKRLRFLSGKRRLLRVLFSFLMLLVLDGGTRLVSQTTLFPALRESALAKQSFQLGAVEADSVRENYQFLRRSKLSGQWYAALVSLEAEDRFRIDRVFSDYDTWIQFLESEDPLLESWIAKESSDPRDGLAGYRRISAIEQLSAREAGDSLPTLSTLTYAKNVGTAVQVYQVEFSLFAAEEVQTRRNRFLRERETKLGILEALSAQGEDGAVDAWTQWTALGRWFEQYHQSPVFETTLPLKPGDRFVAFEYEVDQYGFLDRVVRFFNESDIQRDVVDGREVLRLRSSDGGGTTEAWAFERVGTSAEIRRADASLAGQSALQIRVVDGEESDVRLWNRVEFGESQLLEQTSLAMYGVIHAYMDRSRRDLALKKSRLDLFAEPVFAGLSIGGGISGVGFPLGGAARLAYNLAVGPRFVTQVPTIEELREMMRLLAIRKGDPELNQLSPDLLTESDAKELQKRANELFDREMGELIESANEDDLKAMLRLAKFQRADAKYSLFVNILTGIAKVTGESESGILKDIFNNSYVAPNGDVSVSTILASVLGEKVLTPLSGVSLRALAKGDGPAKAWFQYFNASVDFRAVLNTFRRMMSSDRAEKELSKPIPHAPRLTDLAAYEFRVFGFPLLIFHKRGLQKEEREAYENDYAYGLLGTRVVERFATRESMDEEILAGRMAPLGYVKVMGADGKRRNSNLAVFAHVVPEGRHAGKTTVVIYGIKAFRQYSELMLRELKRFEAFESALKDGAVIERLVDAEDRSEREALEFEATISRDSLSAGRRFDHALSHFLDYQAALRRQTLGLEGAGGDAGRSRDALRDIGIDPVVENGQVDFDVDSYYSSFRFRQQIDGKWEERELVRIFSLDRARESARAGDESAEVERIRRRVARGEDSAVMFVNHAIKREGEWEIGALYRGPQGALLGEGVRVALSSRQTVLDLIEKESFSNQARFFLNRYAPTRFDLPVGQNGETLPLFVSVEFPLSGRFEYDRLNQSSGLPEKVWMDSGNPIQVASDHLVTRYDYTASGLEKSSKTYLNTSHRDDPEVGDLIEESLSLSSVSRYQNEHPLDPSLERLTSLRLNHITGSVSREIYGLYNKPLIVIDPFFVTTNEFSLSGDIQRSLVFLNETERSENIKKRLGIESGLQVGAARFVKRFPSNSNSNLNPGVVMIEEEDLILDWTRNLYFDSTYAGRTLGESYQMSLDEGLLIPITITSAFSKGFHSGLIPVRTTTLIGDQMDQHTSSETLGFDPANLELEALVRPQAGLVTTNRWRAPFRNPIQVSSRLRKTDFLYDEAESSVSFRMLDASGGALLASGTSNFDSDLGEWKSENQHWYDTDVPLVAFTETRNRAGFLLSQNYDVREVRPVYRSNGEVLRNEIYMQSNPGGVYDLLVGVERDVRWESDRSRSQMEVLIGGEVIDRYEIERDLAGRTIVDGRRSVNGLDFETRIIYDGGSFRVEQTDWVQDDFVLESRTWGPFSQAENASYEIEVSVARSSGPGTTEWWPIGDGTASASRIRSQNGRITRVTSVFPETGLSKGTTTFSEEGRPIARTEFVRFETDAAGVDLSVVRKQQLNPWGAPSVGEELSYLRGTSKLYSQTLGERRTYFHVSQQTEVPLIAVDLSEQQGRSMVAGGKVYENAVSIFEAVQVSDAESDVEGGADAVTNPSTMVDELDLRPLFSQIMIRRRFDPFGNLIQKSFFKGGANDNPQTLTLNPENFSAIRARLEDSQALIYDYAPGWMVETNDLKWGTVYQFSDQDPGEATNVYPVNQNGNRDQLTLVSSYRGIPSLLTLTEESESPKIIREHPFGSGVQDSWTAWEVDLLDPLDSEEPEKKKIYSKELVRNAAGVGLYEQSKKETASGRAAYNVGYRIPRPSGTIGWESVRWDEEGKSESLLKGDSLDLGNLDYVFFYIKNPGAMEFGVEFLSAGGSSLKGGAGELLNKDSEEVPFWSFASHENRWLPNPVDPELRLSLARESFSRPVEVRAVCVHDLRGQGWGAEGIESIRLIRLDSIDQEIQVSSLFTLGRPDGQVILADERARRFISQPTERGFQRGRVIPLSRTALEEEAEQDTEFSTNYQGLPIMISQRSEKSSPYPDISIIDASDPIATRPLYTITSRNGEFRSHYQMVDIGGFTQIYTVVNGFDVPKYEVFDKRILGEELSPGFMGYGYDYHASVPLSRMSGGGAWLASIKNRIAANPFRYYGQRLWDRFADRAEAAAGMSEHTSRFSYPLLHKAKIQAEAVSRLPTLAGIFVTQESVPWDGDRATNIDESAFEDVLRSVGMRLFELQVSSFGKNRTPLGDATYLIPTSPGTKSEPFVDTVKEGEIIRLAVGRGEYGVARELLDFYRLHSQDGVEPVHATYDGESGTALTMELGFARAQESKVTAAAQLSIAEGALALSRSTGLREYFNYSSRLYDLLAERFRDPFTGGTPRGLCRYPTASAQRVFSQDFYPESLRFSTADNARFLRGLVDLAKEGRRIGEQDTNVLEWESIADELKAWFQQYLMPEVESSAVVPSGVFELREITVGERELAVERWTSPDGWLAFLEVAQLLGVEEEIAHRLLENLAKVHGVWVEERWGLDWSLPLLREESVSSELTAYFYRVSKGIGHQEAASFSASHLMPLISAGGLPSVVTRGPPSKPMKTGQGGVVMPNTEAGVWPESLPALGHLSAASMDEIPVGATPAIGSDSETPGADVWELNDWRLFLWFAGGFYLAVLIATLLWWRFRLLRSPPSADGLEGELVPMPVMERAEERWAKRVLGMQIPEGTSHSRLSNAPVEHNFLMQLRAIYKLVIEWRRLENGWDETSGEIVDSDSDDWLNGLDEFATMLGIYMRYVVKAGCKDGLPQADVLEECEDSNHIWSRLVMFLSEPYWGLMSLMRRYRNAVTHQEKASLYGQISELLLEMGMRQRKGACDARVDFNYPVRSQAFDMMVIQRPGAKLKDVLMNASMKLRIPFSHFAALVERFKSFKRRENVDPVHPYVIELAKLLPHFGILAIGALVYYNQFRIGDSPLSLHAASEAIALFRNPWSLFWILPLLLGGMASIAGYVTRVYRYDSSMLERERPGMLLDATLTALVGRKHRPMPELKKGRWWDPHLYDRVGLAGRCFGYVVLLGFVLQIPASSFASFLLFKGVFGLLISLEVGGLILPLIMSGFSKWIQDQSWRRPSASVLKFVNSLNITATRPASPIWLSIKYHFQPSVPSGDLWSRIQSIGFYFGFVLIFFAVGGFICQEVLALWFNETYLTGGTWKLAIGGLLFWNTMYLLRYGLFVLLTGIGSLFTVFPFRSLAASWCVALVLMKWQGMSLGTAANGDSFWAISVTGLFVLGALFEENLVSIISRLRTGRFKGNASEKAVPADSDSKIPADAKLGVVYVGGDDVGHLKLTPELLMDRWRLLDENLGAKGPANFQSGLEKLDRDELRNWFSLLYDLEQKSQVTLWHPEQLRCEADPGKLVGHERLEIVCADESERQNILKAWMIRRWLVSMMSSAGHSQDTSIDLVEIAGRMGEESLGARCVFYLIQNKYDGREDNRPVQSNYQKGELALRDKLAELLEWMAPGAKAVSLQNWTPFGFKSGVMTGMDLVFEESLKVSSMLVLDRNATVADMDNLMLDIKESMANPDQVISITSRGTTNTLTEIGKGSQLIEEGHRSFLRGVMSWLGGRASEGVGTGWGNLLANTYGRVQSAMVDSRSQRMPLTSRMQRGSSFALRTEGLIGFGPHAVGISEDTWAVSQTAHNISAMGGTVSFTTSRAFWHKIRETWSHAEWPAAFPRWSGGYLQMMHDPIMQRINDFGPASVFSKEVRANSGRSFLMVPFALVNILLLPLAILLDVTPFVQILVVLWNLGFVMNQVLTIHGLSVSLETSGFSRILGGLGAMLGGALSIASDGGIGMLPFAVTVGLLYGGFFVGINRWLYSRLRDVMLFGPQLVFHTLGQWMRQTIEFVASGAAATDAEGVNMAYRVTAGPREDRPAAQYPHFINLRTIFWLIGVPSIVLNLISLSRLDMFNTLLLLPSLLFSVSLVMGPFLMAPKSGLAIGAWTFLPRIAGWITVAAGLMVTSMMIAGEGLVPWLGMIGLIGVVVGLLWVPGKFLLFHRRMNGALDRCERTLGQFDLSDAQKSECLSALKGFRFSELKEHFNKGGIQKSDQSLRGGIDSLARLLSKLKSGVSKPINRWNPRWMCEYRRSLLVAFGVLVWFFVVPVPGLFVLSAGEYKTSLSLQGILGGLSFVVCLTLIGLGLSRLLQRRDRGELIGKGLRQRSDALMSRLHGSQGAGRDLSPRVVSEICGDFVEYFVFLDQESYAYARRVLERIERRFAAANER